MGARSQRLKSLTFQPRGGLAFGVRPAATGERDANPLDDGTLDGDDHLVGGDGLA